MSYLDQYFLKYLYYSLTVFILIFLLDSALGRKGSWSQFWLTLG